MGDGVKLKRDLGLISLIGIGAGGMIGSGIFAMPAVMGGEAGPSLMLAILIAGFVTLLLAIAYAELGAAFPLTGGPYALPRLAFGDLGGFLMGWGYTLYLVVGTAAITNIFIVYLGFAVPGLVVGDTLTPLGIALAIVALWLFTLINLVGVKWGGLYGLVTTIGKLIPLAIFAAVGLLYMKGGNYTPFMPFGWKGITIAVTLFFWAYTGFEAIVVPAEEVKNPSRTIPLAIILTMVLVVGVYILVAFSFVGMIDWQGLGLAVGDWKGVGALSSPLATVARGMGLPLLAAIAMIGGMISTGGAGGNWVLFQGRIPYAMAHDGMFWKPMARVHRKWHTPHLSLIFTSILTTVVLIVIPNFPSIALIASITALVPYSAAALSLPILRKTRPDAPRPFKLPIPLAITGAGFVLSTLLIYWACWPWTIVGAIMMLAAYPFFLLIRTHNLELRRTAWLPVYLLGIVAMSILGDPHFQFKNFTSFEPMGIFPMPYDMIILSAFAVAIFAWAYHANKNQIPSSKHQ